jgi:hypothetical protein
MQGRYSDRKRVGQPVRKSSESGVEGQEFIGLICHEKMHRIGKIQALPVRVNRRQHDILILHKDIL